MEKLDYKLYCPECKKIVDVYECNRQEKLLPEIKPEFDVIKVCCSICNKPIMKVTALHKSSSEEGEK
jgi:hypothetical protein